MGGSLNLSGDPDLVDHEIGLNATISGGYYNFSSGLTSSVSGGYGNRASGTGASVSGGRNNKASGDNSFVGGGGHPNPAYGNEAFSNYSAVLGGAYNIADDNTDPENHGVGELATITSGDTNWPKDGWSSITGGLGNTTESTHTSVNGGAYNTADNTYATVSGGHNNTASGASSTVSGGLNNTASNAFDSIVGEVGGSVCGQHSDPLIATPTFDFSKLLRPWGGYDRAKGETDEILSKIYACGPVVSYISIWQCFCCNECQGLLQQGR